MVNLGSWLVVITLSKSFDKVKEYRNSIGTWVQKDRFDHYKRKKPEDNILMNSTL